MKAIDFLNWVESTCAGFTIKQCPRFTYVYPPNRTYRYRVTSTTLRKELKGKDYMGKTFWIKKHNALYFSDLYINNQGKLAIIDRNDPIAVAMADKLARR